jgi:hypothetical protein
LCDLDANIGYFAAQQRRDLTVRHPNLRHWGQSRSTGSRTLPHIGEC